MGFFTNSLKSIVNSLVKLSRPIFSFEDSKLKFKVNSDDFYSYPLENFETKTRHDSYVVDAYTIKTENLFIEHIHIDSDSTWRGLASSLYISFFKTTLNIKKMELLEKIEYSGYEFNTYRVDNHLILNFIYIYEINKDTFILDVKSDLYEKLLKKFDSSYSYMFEKNIDDKMNLDLSIVRDNAINSYFGYDN